MPRLPLSQGPSVNAAPLPGAFQRGFESDAGFGGAQARQMGDLAKAGAQFTQLMEREALRDDQAKADAAYVTLQNEYAKQSLEWKKNRVGANADGITGDADQWWAEAEQKFNTDLTDRQKALLAVHARGLRTRGMADIGQFQLTQKAKFANDSGTAFISSQIQEAASNPALNAASTREAIRNKVIELKGVNGWDDTITQNEITRYTTLMHASVVKTMTASGNAGEARKYLEQARAVGDVDPGKASDLENAIKREEEHLRQQERIRKSDDEKAASDAVWQAIANGRRPSQTDLDRMDGKERVQVNSYFEARAKAAAKDGRLHAKEDNYDVLDEAEKRLAQGDITDPKQLERYAPFLRAETFRTLRKALDKRDEVPRGELERAFFDRLGKTKAKMSDGERQQWLAFQDYIHANVKETKRPEDVEHWADRWFMKGSGTEDSFLRRDPGTFGEAKTKGRKDFAISTPEGARADVDAALTTMRQAGVKLPTSEGVRDRFYTDHYLDASRWFAARGEAVSPPRAAAYAILKQNNKPITPANINAVIGQLKGPGSAQPRQPAR